MIVKVILSSIYRQIDPTHTSSSRYHTHHQPPYHHISSHIQLVLTHRTYLSPQYQVQHILIPYPIRPYSLLKYISTPLYNTYYIPIYPTANMFLASQTPSPILFSYVQHFPFFFSSLVFIVPKNPTPLQILM